MEPITLSDGQTLYDPEQWLIKKEAAKHIGKTERTVERWRSERGVRSLKLNLPAQHEQAVFFKPDLDRLLEEDKNQLTPTFREPTSPTPRQGDNPDSNGHALSPINTGFPTRPTATTRMTPDMSGASALALASFLSEHGVYMEIEAAKKLTHLSEHAIKQAAKDGRVTKWPRRDLYRTVDLLML